MDRMRFLSRMLASSLFLLLYAPPSAEAQSDDGFTMSSGSLMGGANGTQGA